LLEEAFDGQWTFKQEENFSYSIACKKGSERGCALQGDIAMQRAEHSEFEKLTTVQKTRRI